MTWLVLTLTLRQLLGQRRVLFLAAVAVLPLVAAIIARASSGGVDASEYAADVVEVVLYGLIVTALLPLTAVLLSTAALGSEIEDGTIVYLLSKPSERWRILAGKLLAAWGATTAIVVASALVGGVVALAGKDEWSILGGFVVALVVGSLAYSSLFLMLSLFTSRALLVGISYAFIWEGVITNFAPGVQRFSIREYTASIAEAVGDPAPWVFEAELGTTYSVILVVIVTTVAAALAVRRLSQFQLSGEA